MVLKIENRYPVPFILDCGSTISLISYSNLIKIIKNKNKIQKARETVDIILANGSSLETLGWIKLKICVKKLRTWETFIVTPSQINILGLTFFQNRRIGIEYKRDAPKIYINGIEVLGAREEHVQSINMVDDKPGADLIIYDDDSKFVLNGEDAYLIPELSDNSTLDMFDIGEKYEDYKQSVIEMLKKHDKLLDGKIGRITVIEPVELKLVKNSPDGHITPYRRRSIPEKIIISALIKELVDMGVAELTSEPTTWVAQLVIVPKAVINEKGLSKRQILDKYTDPSAFRLCCDYRAINSYLACIQYPLENIETLLYQLSSASSCSILDISSAFHTIELSDNSQQYLTFQGFDEQLNKKLYKMKRLGQGISQASSIFQSAMDKILDGLPKDLRRRCKAYVDDLTVLHLTEDVTTEIKVLNDILAHLERCGLKINVKKMKLFQTRFMFLGHLIEDNRITVCPKRLSGIKNLKVPSSKKELQMILGAANYIRKHLPSQHLASAVLYKKLDQIEKGKFDEEARRAYNQLVSSLENAIKLNFPVMDSPMVIFSDSSDIAIATFICQFSRNDKYLTRTQIQALDWNNIKDLANYIKIHPLSCMSKSLNKAEQKAPIAMKELLAICYTLSNNRELLSNDLVFMIDSQTCINWLRGTSEINTTVVCANRVRRLINRIHALCPTPKILKLIKSASLYF